MAAINAAGYDAEADSTSNHPLRAAVRQHLIAKKLPVVDELRRFLREHRQDNPTQTLSLYVSYALCVEAPDFRFRMRRNDLPPEVLALADLNDLMKRFHADAGIEEIWKQAQPAFEAELARYHEPVLLAVQQAAGYLRVPSGGSSRRFQIYLDLLGAPHQVHVRSYGAEFFVVVTPSPDPMIDDIRHAYLQFLVDPLILRNHEIVERKKGLGDFAGAAPLLPEAYKQDFQLLLQKSLVKAIEARLLSGPGAAARREQMVSRALAEGYILTPYFAESLAAYEKQEQSMRLYFPELIEGIDLKKEDKRLEKVQFATTAVPRTVAAPAPPPPPPLSPAEKALEEGEDLFARQQVKEAGSRFQRALDLTTQDALQAKAYYGLARVAVRNNDPETAEKLFLRALELGPDPVSKAWCLVYLGRLYDIAKDTAEADRRYREAAAIEGASEKALDTARRGLQGEFRRDAKTP